MFWFDHPRLRSFTLALTLVITLGLTAGCRLVVGTAAVAVGAVGLVGYGVYKTGEAAANGVSSAVSGDGKSSDSVVFLDGAYKATSAFTVTEVRAAAEKVLVANQFQVISSGGDAFSGVINAQTWDGTAVTIGLTALAQDKTETQIRIGDLGNLNQSEMLYKMIEKEIERRRAEKGTKL